MQHECCTRSVNQSGGWEAIVQQQISTRTGQSVRFHPTDEGYLIIAETWFETFLEDAVEADRFVLAGMLSLLLDEH